MSCVLQRVYKSVWHAIKSFNEFVRLPIALFVVFATILIVKSYHFYIPPKFNTGFLAGRETYFFSTPYAVGFYLHIVGAPLALIAGTLQFSRTILKRLPKLHRTLGRTAIISTIGFATPGGLIMAFGTRTGSSAVLCFLVMNLLTAWFAWMAWRTAVARRFVDHRRWAWRCYLMLASAILLRIIDPVLRETGVPDLQSYRLSIWLSWLPSLVCYEILHSRWSLRIHRN
jgi:hypothetical protein